VSATSASCSGRMSIGERARKESCELCCARVRLRSGPSLVSCFWLSPTDLPTLNPFTHSQPSRPFPLRPRKGCVLHTTNGRRGENTTFPLQLDKVWRGRLVGRPMFHLTPFSFTDVLPSSPLFCESTHLRFILSQPQILDTTTLHTDRL
jgi:hypothetical protein